MAESLERPDESAEPLHATSVSDNGNESILHHLEDPFLTNTKSDLHQFTGGRLCVWVRHFGRYLDVEIGVGIKNEGKIVKSLYVGSQLFRQQWSDSMDINFSIIGALDVMDDSFKTLTKMPSLSQQSLEDFSFDNLMTAFDFAVIVNRQVMRTELAPAAKIHLDTCLWRKMKETASYTLTYYTCGPEQLPKQRKNDDASVAWPAVSFEPGRLLSPFSLPPSKIL
ncbi:hypothetical protein DAPPUDRAFT_107737 [Daphnia pulex]|uniref:Uncharacterized protein n=1 Tax=Daphnia pulex TaxID=6669 RepID=E9GY26_DAPPU|nr:hypothetical protein DAPPUDRAFT_107737 [Daphnia pulex]|eukprot:EFX75634.1 hypothetical protein DAPPUDRAFT_107737 [Daphnia pulex]